MNKAPKYRCKTHHIWLRECFGSPTITSSLNEQVPLLDWRAVIAGAIRELSCADAQSAHEPILRWVHKRVAFDRH